LLLLVPTTLLIYINISARNHLLLDWIVQLVGLLPLIIAYEYQLHAFIVKLDPPLIWNVCISHTPENSQMRHIRLVSSPVLLRCLVLEYLVRTSVLHIHCALHSFCPELLRHVLRLQCRTNHVENGLILSLGHPVLLRSVRSHVEPSDSMLLAKNLKVV
jgi:hypothetical protein